MQDKKDFQEFDLDDILNEFHDLPEDSGDLGELSGDLAQLLGDWDAEEAPAAEAVSAAQPAALASPAEAQPRSRRHLPPARHRLMPQPSRKTSPWTPSA